MLRGANARPVRKMSNENQMTMPQHMTTQYWKIEPIENENFLCAVVWSWTLRSFIHMLTRFGRFVCAALRSPRDGLKLTVDTCILLVWRWLRGNEGKFQKMLVSRHRTVLNVEPENNEMRKSWDNLCRVLNFRATLAGEMNLCAPM